MSFNDFQFEMKESKTDYTCLKETSGEIQEKSIFKNGPDAILFRHEEEKELFERINSIRKAFTLREEKKNYENHLKLLSDTKLSTDKFFDNVKVNDENKDLKNNRLELLQILCSTFNSFVDFSKLEGT